MRGVGAGKDLITIGLLRGASDHKSRLRSLNSELLTDEAIWVSLAVTAGPPASASDAGNGAASALASGGEANVEANAGVSAAASGAAANAAANAAASGTVVANGGDAGVTAICNIKKHLVFVHHVTTREGW